MYRFPISALLTVTLALLSVGCASSDPSYDAKMATVDSIQSVRDEVTKGLNQIDKTVASLDDLVNSPKPDLRKQYQTYNGNVRKLEDVQKSVRKRAASMRANAQKYFDRWQSDMAKTDRAELQKVAADRSAAARAGVDEIAAELSRTKAAFLPLMDELSDIQAYLANDLTPAGIDAIKPIAAEVPGNAGRTRESVTKILDTLKRVQTDLSPKPVK